MTKLMICLTGIAASLAASATASPTPAERRMAAYVEADRGHGEALLERLVNQNSGTLNLEGVRAVGAMVRPELEALGFTVEWRDMAATGRAGHLVATHRGNGRGKRILLIGHLDTVFEPTSTFQTYAREGNRGIGPGTGDDKGGDVVIIQALRAMQAAGTLRDADIMVVMTGDEERTGAPLDAARRDLIAAGEWADVALEYENLATTGDGATRAEYGTVARRSSGSWEIRTTGRTGHSSGIFNAAQGYGAIYELARILDQFRRELPEANLTYNVGVMAGGTPATIDAARETVTATGKTNIIASTAIARGDIRTLTVEQDARIRAAMQAIVAQHLPGTGAEISFDESYPPMAPTAGNRALLAQLNAVNRDMGLPEMAEYDPARRGAADSSFVAALADTMGGLGAVGELGHAEGEWIELDSLPRQALRSAVLITRLSRTPR